MIRAHAEAILNRLRDEPVLATKTFEGVVEERPSTYVTVFLDSGLRSAERFTGPQSLATFTLTVHSVARAADEAQGLSDRVFGQLLDFVPEIEGRVAYRIRHVSSQPVQLDRDLKPPLYWLADQFELASSPA